MPIEYASNVTSAIKYSFVRDASIINQLLIVQIHLAVNSKLWKKKFFSPKFPEKNCDAFLVVG